ncbi:hypothetical protein CPC197_1570, partial [Chlamydia psittaci C1/97]
INRTQSSFSGSFFPVFTEDGSFLTIDVYELSNITLQFPQEQY